MVPGAFNGVADKVRCEAKRGHHWALVFLSRAFYHCGTNVGAFLERNLDEVDTNSFL
jgi:hypothetical protein